MKKYSRLCVVLLVVVMLGALPLLASCKKEEAKPARTAKIKTPDIIKEGTLKVGVNLGFAPYATKVDGEYVGYDVEVADYLAEQLGLYPEFVAVDPDQIEEKLNDGTVDVVLSAPMDTSGVAVSGPYSEGGVAYYTNSSTEESMAEVSASYPVGVQKNSVGYWKLLDAIGAENITTYKTDSELIRDLQAGAIKYGVLDSVVGSYAQAGGSMIKLVDYVEGKSALGIASASGKKTLSGKIDEIMKSGTTTSLFESLNRKWLTAAQQSSADTK